ncbi:MAG: large conductance mechanosensitive channel protein MscL [Jatrophihabitans sp.]
MLKGFKDFIMRGNLIELAVAFVIGAAFAKLVQDFVGAIITPLISALPGSKVSGFGFSIRGGVLKQPTFISLSVVINSVIVFLATAAVVYFALVIPMNRINERRALRTAKGEPDPTPKSEDIQLLEQIRDLLARQPGQVSQEGRGGLPGSRPRP